MVTIINEGLPILHFLLDSSLDMQKKGGKLGLLLTCILTLIIYIKSQFLILGFIGYPLTVYLITLSLDAPMLNELLLSYAGFLLDPKMEILADVVCAVLGLWCDGLLSKIMVIALNGGAAYLAFSGIATRIESEENKEMVQEEPAF